MNIFNSKLFWCLLVCAGLLLPFRSQAASYDVYLSLNGITGGATNGLIQVDSFSWSESIPVTLSGLAGPGIGKPAFTAIGVQKPLDISSPILVYNSATGLPITSAVLTIKNRATGNVLYTITLGNVYITNVTSSGGGGGLPEESVSLTFETIQWSYQALDSSGNPTGSPVTHSFNVTGS
jgi:type VI secretion system secreted protein Hcp